ncbi:MAG: hypothetical protein L3J71_08210 [Victivallaceae bacterium]|nr:hypothetical protein [Victivallaceae bacterium]
MPTRQKYLIALVVTMMVVASSMVATAADVVAGDTITIKSSQLKIQGGARKVTDNGASVLAVSPTDKGWHIQLPLKGKVASGNYKVRALVKVTGGKAGYGVRFAIYSPAAKGCPFKKVIKATEIPASDKYEWVELGETTVTADPKAYFFISSAGDSSFEQFLVKTIEFIPISK